LSFYRGQNKKYFDLHAKPLVQLNPGETVRMKTKTGWMPAKVVKKTLEPRSYIVMNEEGASYRRNRRDILKTNEKPITVLPPDIHVQHKSELIPPLQAQIHVPAETVPQMHGSPPRSVLKHVPVQAPTAGVDQAPQQDVKMTSRGRVIKPPVKLNDYVV
jgi:hypothetical protein